MSKNALALEKTALQASLTAPELLRGTPRTSQYQHLIRRHFQNRSVVAIVAISGQSGGDICEDIAVELATLGNRVVIVSVDALSRTNHDTLPQEWGFAPGRTSNVWCWPAPLGGQVEFFKSHTASSRAGSWLDSLRLNFNSVLLNCSAIEGQAASELAAMADAAILVVEAGRTRKKQIQSDQRALQLRGVKLVGCILTKRK